MNWADWLGVGIQVLGLLAALGHLIEAFKDGPFIKKAGQAVGTAVFGLFAGAVVIGLWGGGTLATVGAPPDERSASIPRPAKDKVAQQENKAGQRLAAAIAKLREMGFKPCDNAMFCKPRHFYASAPESKVDKKFLSLWLGDGGEKPAYQIYVEFRKDNDTYINITTYGRKSVNFRILGKTLELLYSEKWKAALKTATASLRSGKSMEDASTGFHVFLPRMHKDLIDLTIRKEPWWQMAMSELRFWVENIYPKHECKALEIWKEKILHCAPSPYQENAGKGSDIVFALINGAWHPLNGTTQSKIDSPYVRRPADEFGGVPVSKEFVRGDKAIHAFQVFEALKNGEAKILN